MREKNTCLLWRPPFSSQDYGRALKIINELHTSSRIWRVCAEELISHFRSLMLFKTMKDPGSFFRWRCRNMSSWRAQAHQFFSLEGCSHHLDCLQECQGKMFREEPQGGMEMAAVRLCVPGVRFFSRGIGQKDTALEAAVKQRNTSNT